MRFEVRSFPAGRWYGDYIGGRSALRFHAIHAWSGWPTDKYPPKTSPLDPLWETREIAGGQFKYAFIRDPSDHQTSLWFMEFQNQVKAIVDTGEAIAGSAPG
jgi:hypothetical protein